MLKHLCWAVMLAFLAGGPGDGASTGSDCPDFGLVKPMFSKDPKATLWFTSLIDLYGHQLNPHAHKYLYRVLRHGLLKPFQKGQEFVDGTFTARANFTYPSTPGKRPDDLHIDFAIHIHFGKYRTSEINIVEGYSPRVKLGSP